MNASFRFAVKACVLAAVCGALLNQTAGVFAQDGGTTQSDATTSSKIRRTAGYQPAPSQSGAQPSEVQKKLQELYRKDGREMPSMNLDDAPNTQPVVNPPTAAMQAPPQGASPASPAQGGPAAKQSKPSFFERFFHVGRGRKQPAQATTQPARPAPLPAQPYRYSQPQQAARPAAPVYRPPLVSAPAPRPVVQPPLREPAAIGSPESTPEVTAQPATPGRRPGQRNGFPQPLMDDADSQDDSESLELNQDDQKKVATQPPQILPNQSTNGPAESPYTGVKISPNEMEQKAASAPKIAAEPAPPAKAVVPEPKPIAAPPAPPAALPAPVSAGPVASTQPATLPAPGAAGPLAAIARPAARSPSASKAGSQAAKDKDDDDDDDDDDEPLTLSTDNTGKTAVKPLEPIVEKPAAEIAKPVVAEEMKGFRGFCPVVLKDDRKLIEARPHIRSEYRGKIYTFSSVDAKDAFDDNPYKYIPAGEGRDMVKHTAGEEGIEGTLEHAAWYRGRLYLFSSAETRREFVETPGRFMTED
jgi:YHS domain-containing protein